MLVEVDCSSPFLSWWMLLCVTKRLLRPSILVTSTSLIKRGVIITVWWCVTSIMKSQKIELSRVDISLLKKILEFLLFHQIELEVESKVNLIYHLISHIFKRKYTEDTERLIRLYDRQISTRLQIIQILSNPQWEK